MYFELGRVIKPLNGVDMKENEREVFVDDRRSGKTTYAIKRALEKVREGRDVLFVVPTSFTMLHHSIPTFIDAAEKAGYETVNAKGSGLVRLRKNGVDKPSVKFDSINRINYDPRNTSDIDYDHRAYKIFDEYGANLSHFDLITMTGTPSKRILNNKLNRKLYPNMKPSGNGTYLV